MQVELCDVVATLQQVGPDYHGKGYRQEHTDMGPIDLEAAQQHARDSKAEAAVDEDSPECKRRGEA